MVFDTVHGYWATLPEDSRPKFYLYGLSLGSYGVGSVLNSVSIINEPIDGALMSGPPFVNELHKEIVANREPGTPPWQPIYREGRTVRFTAEQPGFDKTPGPWGPTRLVYLQHNSDPVVFFSPELALEEPDWLKPGQRGPDISPEMGWFPLVTMWQVALDLPGAGNVPWGFGHMYTYRSNLESWVQITQLEGWTDGEDGRGWSPSWTPNPTTTQPTPEAPDRDEVPAMTTGNPTPGDTRTRRPGAPACVRAGGAVHPGGMVLPRLGAALRRARHPVERAGGRRAHRGGCGRLVGPLRAGCLRGVHPGSGRIAVRDHVRGRTRPHVPVGEGASAAAAWWQPARGGRAAGPADRCAE